MEPWMAQARRQHGVISTAELRRFGPAPTSGASQGRGTRRRTADHCSRPLGRGQGRGFVQVGSGSLAVRWIRAKTPGCILGTAIRATYVIPTGCLSTSTPPSEEPFLNEGALGTSTPRPAERSCGPGIRWWSGRQSGSYAASGRPLCLTGQRFLCPVPGG